MADFILSYFLTLLIEGLILFFLLKKFYKREMIIRNVIIANSLTLPVVWFVFPLLGMNWIVQTTISELFAIVAEMGIYILLFGGLNARKALLVCTTCNVTSFGIGFLFL